MTPLVECVPNFSEGRDRAQVDAIVEAMMIPGVCLLDREMDADHNRSVITLAGEPGAIEEAAIRGVGRAAELIDLTRHRGAHPRMGAADVVPFVPIAGVSLEDCVAMARRAGAEIARRFGIPVYLYEAAAATEERRNLETIRRGQFEGIAREIADNPARRPDFGEPRLHPTAGATAVGARRLLIAYNIFLDTADVEVARRIARAIRFSSGGLRHVKASGFLVRGAAQVSMNLTDFEQTPVHQVFELVRREAAQCGAAPVSSEVVGLIPRAALEEAGAFYLQIENFHPGLILENRLAAVAGGATAPGRLRSGVDPFLNQLAAPAATPGGGSAAAAAGAMAAALVLMVASIERRRKDRPGLGRMIEILGGLLEQLRSAIDADAAAYEAVVRARRAARESGDRDWRAIAAALEEAARVPLAVAEGVIEVMEIARDLEQFASPGSLAAMSSEMITAKALAAAAADGALANVADNLEFLRRETAGRETGTPEKESFLHRTRVRLEELRVRR